MDVTLGSIGSSNLGSAGDSTTESSLTSKAFNVLEVVVILRPVDVFKRGSNSKLILRKIYTEINYFAADLFLPNSPRSSLSTQTIQPGSMKG
jgi:hypothetical protein